MRKYKVIIADDHTIVADGVQEILKSAPNIEVVATVSNGQEVLDAMNEQHADLVLMDINMPVMNGFVCTKRLRKEFPETKVIALTMYNQRHIMNELMEAGADGCIMKNNTGTALISVIDCVMSGNTYFDHIKSFKGDGKKDQNTNLSSREIEIIRMIAEGLMTKEIAERLFISEHTVKTHRKNIHRKLDIGDSAQLIQFAMNEGLL